MNINWGVIRKNLRFLVALIRPSLAKALSVPLLLAGLSVLNTPLWLEAVNWVLIKQDLLPQYKEPLYQAKDSVGWVLIFLSLMVYLIEVILQIKLIRQEASGEILDAVKDFPEKTADFMAKKLKSEGFTGQHLQDKEIERQVSEISRLRFFGSFSRERKGRVLAEGIINGELSGGGSFVKARALALLARYLCVGDKAGYSRELLSVSKKICKTDEAEIAQAFMDALDSEDVNAASGLLKVSDPSSYSAFFMIKKIIEGEGEALKWFEEAGLMIEDLDDDGKTVLISTLLSEQQWDKSLKQVEKLSDDVLSSTPALAQVSAFACLVNAIKAHELREGIMAYIPLAADKFPLADDAESIKLRNRSVFLFKACSSLALQYGDKNVASFADSYILWLELRNSETSARAKQELQSYFNDYDRKTIEYFPLGVSFGVEIDFGAVEGLANRLTALSHDDVALSLARFILAQTKKTSSEVLAYIDTHREQIEKAVNFVAIAMLEIEALARSGLVDDAQILLEKIEKSGASGGDVRNLQNIIDSAKGQDPVALAIAQYQDSGTTSDLAHLVDLLEKGDFREKYYSYCCELFERTSQEFDAIRVCNAASLLGKFAELHEFLRDRFDIVERSDGLQAHWAWSLFRMGELKAAKVQVERLRGNAATQASIKDLDVNLSIYGGDWESLSLIVEDSWSNREALGPHELLQSAQLAKAVSPQRARQILEFCVAKYRENPNVLASSYLTATTMGWEEEKETSGWLKRAIALSGEEGPLQMTSLEDLKIKMSEGRRNQEDVYKAYLGGDAPVFTVAKFLNRTMSDYYLVQPWGNKSQKDIRRKNLVPAFYNLRERNFIEADEIALDLSGAMVLENIGFLYHLNECFERIVLPHSFMQSLFEEKQKVSFHQPSQIERAKYFERLVFDGKVSIFDPKKINDPELALNVGDELASLLEEADADDERNSQVFVVCSSPVHKVDESLEGKIVDLARYHHCLLTCSQLIKIIHEMAVVTEAQSLKALRYLRKDEEDWPNKIQVKKGAKLFIDSLSLSNLITTDMLERLSEAGFLVYVHKEQAERYSSLVSYDSIIKFAESKIENIRKIVCGWLTSGRAVVARMPLNKVSVASQENDHVKSIEEIFEAVRVSGSAILDDRFYNKHRFISLDEVSFPIFTSLDFIETLYHKNIISKEEMLDARALLRELGFQFVNILPDELEYHLSQSALIDGELMPTRQLKLLKEGLLLVRISGLVQLPRDAGWLTDTLRTISEVIKAQWSGDDPVDICFARSSWLYELMSYREWAQTHQVRGAEGLAYMGEVLRANMMMIVPRELPDDKAESYKRWLDEVVLEPLKIVDPWSFSNVIDSLKQQTRSVSSDRILEERESG